MKHVANDKALLTETSTTTQSSFTFFVDRRLKMMYKLVKSLFNAMLGDGLANYITLLLREIRFDPDPIHLFQTN